MTGHCLLFLVKQSTVNRGVGRVDSIVMKPYNRITKRKRQGPRLISDAPSSIITMSGLL